MSFPVLMLISCFVGVAGTGAGGLLALTTMRPKETHLSFAMAAAGGVMLAVTLLNMLPEALKNDALRGSLGVVAGGLFIYICKGFLEQTRNKGSENYVNIGFLMALGIAVHNLPEGMAVGSGMVSMDASSIGLTVAILLHDAPEGLAVAIPMRMSKMSGFKVVLVTMLSGLPTAIGMLLGYAIGNVSQSFLDFCTGFAAGAMLVLVLSEMIPDSFRIAGKRAAFALVIGVVVGVCIVLVSKL